LASPSRVIVGTVMAGARASRVPDRGSAAPREPDRAASEGRGGPLKGGVVECPFRRSRLPDQLGEIVPVLLVAPRAAFGIEVIMIPLLVFGVRRQRHSISGPEFVAEAVRRQGSRRAVPGPPTSPVAVPFGATAVALIPAGPERRLRRRGEDGASSRASTPGCGKSCSTARFSTACARPRSSARAGDGTTTKCARTLGSAARRLDRRRSCLPWPWRPLQQAGQNANARAESIEPAQAGPGSIRIDLHSRADRSKFLTGAFVGLNSHTASIAIAVADAGRGGEARHAD
jgi:hypothetical protein